MNRLPYISVISLLFFLISIFTIGCAVATRETTASLQAGVAAIDITPTVGDVHYRGSSTGVLDPLMAKAIVFRQGQQQAALVLCDVIGISFDQSDAVRKLAAEKTGIPYENICVAATHTHTGR